MSPTLLVVSAVLLTRQAGTQASAGDVARGERLFQELQSASCHGSGWAGGVADTHAGGGVLPDRLSEPQETMTRVDRLSKPVWRQRIVQSGRHTDCQGRQRAKRKGEKAPFLRLDGCNARCVH